VEQRISGWQSLWSEAEAIYQKQKRKCEQRWHQAFMAAVRPAQYQQ